MLGVGHSHYTVHILVVYHGLENVEEEVVVLYHLLNGIRAYYELAQRVLESHSVEVALVRAGVEVVELLLVLGVDKDNLRLAVRVASFAHSAVKSDAVYPSCRVSLADAASKHTLKINRKVESHRVDIVAVHQYNVSAPLGIVKFLYVHYYRFRLNLFLFLSAICNLSVFLRRNALSHNQLERLQMGCR